MYKLLSDFSIFEDTKSNQIQVNDTYYQVIDNKK
jgi:hypothetical protein